MGRAGVEIDRACLAEWVGRAAFALRPVTERMLSHLRRRPKLYCDETTDTHLRRILRLGGSDRTLLPFGVAPEVP
jgi:hypothetical protein